MRFTVTLAAVLGSLLSVSADAPSGLLADLQVSPALGVRLAPSLGWIVPPCAAAPDQAQIAFQIIVSSFAGVVIWDSGRVTSDESVSALYAGPALNSSTVYTWTVATWTTSCSSEPSEPATFVTAAWDGFSPAARFLSTSTSATFAYFRRELDVPSSPIVSAIVHIAGEVDDKLLCGWKFYLDDVLVNVGPGRGEAPVWGGDNRFRSLPIQTLDVTAALAGAPRASVVALQVMHKTPAIIFQLVARHADGSETTLVSDASWIVLDADAHRNPGASTGGGSSAGTGFVEFIDAREEPVGWRAAGFIPSANWGAAVSTVPTADQLSNLHPRMQPPMTVVNVIDIERIWPVPTPPQPPHGPVACGIAPENSALQLACPDSSPITTVTFASFGTPSGTCPSALAKGSCDAATSQKVVEAACLGKTACSVVASNDNFGGDPCFNTVKSLAVSLKCPTSPPPPAINYTSYVAQFPKEFQGGLRLTVTNGTAGTTVHITCGESLSGTTVGSTWGWEFTWILRDGPQTLEQHKYMECRWVSLTFGGTPPPLAGFTLSAWQVHYPWVESDSSFSSSNVTLDAVYNLCRYTVHAAALDTYTDSNTRERTPYEADGIIAATGRLLVQRDYLFPRHSHAFVLEHPTWPVEWLSITPFLGWQDYMATGQADVALAFHEKMHSNTGLSHLDATGLIDTSNMGSHIVDWMPDGNEADETVARHEFTASNYMSVTNMFAAQGLNLLSQMVGAGGLPGNASAYAAESAALTSAIRSKMWNGTAFCDGVCTDPKVKGASLVMTNMFSLFFGLVPAVNVDSVWSTVTTWGLQQMGDYGAFFYQLAVASGYYAPYYDTPDDGTAILTALTKCDTYSWCSGLLHDNLTMTRESWHDGTYSHGWGSSAIVGVSIGVMGIHQTSPSFATLTIKSKLGSLTYANITVPTIRGYITVSATPGAVNVSVPCNVAATLCAPRSSHDSSIFLPVTHALHLDGVEAPAVASGGHLCLASAVGCGPGGAPRELRVRPRHL